MILVYLAYTYSSLDVYNSYFSTRLHRIDGPVVERLPHIRQVVGSSPGRVIPKTCKMVLNVTSFADSWPRAIETEIDTALSAIGRGKGLLVLVPSPCVGHFGRLRKDAVFMCPLAFFKPHEHHFFTFLFLHCLLGIQRRNSSYFVQPQKRHVLRCPLLIYEWHSLP